MAETRHVTARLPSRDLERLTRLAEAEGRTRSNLIALLVRRGLDAMERDAGKR